MKGKVMKTALPFVMVRIALRGVVWYTGDTELRGRNCREEQKHEPYSGR